LASNKIERENKTKAGYEKAQRQMRDARGNNTHTHMHTQIQTQTETQTNTNKRRPSANNKQRTQNRSQVRGW